MNSLQQLHDKYQSILALRDAEKKDSEVWRKLDFEQKKAFREWLFAMQDATMRDDESIYSDDMKLGK